MTTTTDAAARFRSEVERVKGLANTIAEWHQPSPISETYSCNYCGHHYPCRHYEMARSSRCGRECKPFRKDKHSGQLVCFNCSWSDDDELSDREKRYYDV